MTSRDLARLRLESQLVAPAALRSPAEVVARLGAMQAQQHHSALWAVGLRSGTTLAQVNQAIERREIVRSWPMRRTLHLVAGSDLRWILELGAPRLLRGAAGRLQRLGLDGKTLARAERVVQRALAGGRTLARPALFATLDREGVATTGQRGIHVVWYLAQIGLLCFASHLGKQPALALLDDWLPSAPRRPREEALADLALRYFTGHGPATAADFAWWSAQTLTDARAVASSLRGTLETLSVDGVDYFHRPAARSAGPRPTGDVHLAPAFDELVIGYTDRAATLPPQYLPRIFPGSNGMFMPMLLSGGRVKGTWKASAGKQQVKVAIERFEPLNAREERALERAIERYAHFLGLEAGERPVPRE